MENHYPSCHKLLIALLFLATLGCGQRPIPATAQQVRRGASASSDYSTLLAQYSIADQGAGPEPFFSGDDPQPMTFALVLSAESLRYRATPNQESAQRVRNAALWLADHADFDNDGKPGWGLPQAWDAFSDGSVNPPNQPYTITTALVMDGILDALQIPQFWSADEQARFLSLLSAVAERWCSEAWTDLPTGGGFFWYSTAPQDAQFVPNVSSMMAGAGMRFLREWPQAQSTSLRAVLQSRVDAAVTAMVAAATLTPAGPFWPYIVGRADSGTNDLVHHVYTLWGMELYRAGAGQVKLPWTAQDATRSTSAFLAGDAVREFQQNVNLSEPAELWGTGAAIAYFARWGDPHSASLAAAFAEQAYGSFPLMQRFPTAYSSDATFYPRFAAHVLWGLAIRDFAVPQT